MSYKLITCQLFAFILLSFAGIAQSVNKQKINNLYKNAVSENRVQQKVFDVFSGQTEVTQIDFTKTETSDAAYETKLKGTFKQKNLFQFKNEDAFKQILQQQAQALTVLLPYRNTVLVLDLARTPIFTDDYKVVTNKHPEGVDVNKGVCYQGIVRGQKSIVALSIFSNQAEGIISIEGKPSLALEKLLGDNKLNVHVLYADEDIVQKRPAFICGTTEPGADYLKKYANILSQSKALPAGAKCVTNFWETRYNIYQWQGSTQNVSNYITTLFNNYATVYANESIGMKLQNTYVWTSQDSYNDDLNTFSTNRSNFGADLACLLSTSGGGGVAWIDGICNSNQYYKHAFCGSLGNVSTYPAYSWAVNVTAHEIGHNLGSPHTHNCSWTGGAIDGCGPAAGYSEGCNGPIPAKGTIMSYCHLVNGVGVDLSLGFGTQPGNLIRSHVSNCVSRVCDATSTCTAPQNLAATSVSATSEKLTWTASSATNYYIYYKAASAGTWTLAVSGLTSPTYTFTGLTASTSYNADVYATCPDGTYPVTHITFTTTSAGCVAPQNVYSNSITPTSEKLNWTASGANSYYIYYKKSTAGTWTLAATGITGTSYTISGLTPNVTYNADLYSTCANGTYPVTHFNFVTNGSSSPAHNNLITQSGNQNTSLSVLPNPVKNEATVVLNSSGSEKSKLSVISSIGATVLTQNITTRQGVNTYKVPFSTLSPGIYFINVYQNGKVLSARVLKQ